MTVGERLLAWLRRHGTLPDVEPGMAETMEAAEALEREKALSATVREQRARLRLLEAAAANVRRENSNHAR